MMIYRVEKDGLGPYAGHPTEQVIVTPSGNFHPEPIDDIPNLPCSWMGTMLCGFASMKHLHEWFDKIDLYKLAEAEYNLATYFSNEFFKGYKQVVFKPTNRIKIESLKEFLKE